MWQDRAKQMIAEESLKCYRAANPKPGKKHKPYALPKWVGELVDCLNREDEYQAKVIMNWEFMRDY